MSAKTYEIEISCDHAEAGEFCNWLAARGHKASVGNTTQCSVDGLPTRLNGSADDVMREMWDAYCNG
jgi:hypothetical protein